MLKKHQASSYVETARREFPSGRILSFAQTVVQGNHPWTESATEPATKDQVNCSSPFHKVSTY